MNTSDRIAIGTLAFTVITQGVLVLVWYIGNEKSFERKKYAAERDFNHLKNNQLQISNAINDLLQEVKSDFNILSRDILEIKITLGIDKKHSE
ncbi:hypothetical protein Cylst_5416 [Cylindrospermum stagnale PCC 7417]|uniref:Uncharacterized protein n=1 Tax=Cylindrospermum stagnale PCC 7417 TaxID=56107 RepID=K9X5T3_9NOST|nr:hypothetical protein [Cylindrospermum stagnale]AFZ27436.1 hypothetical protein Cylst_5416 [Cylindrospermum stagnale PCC 7417]